MGLGVTLKKGASESASRGKALAIATARENAGAAGDIADLIIDNLLRGMSPTEAFTVAQDQITQIAPDRYGPAIRAALRRAGLEIADDEDVSPAGVQSLLSEQTGLDFQNLSTAGVKQAIDGLLSARLSAALGIQITTVLDAGSMKAAIDAAVLEALRNGTAERLLTAGLSKAARRVATWRRHGVETTLEQQKILHLAAQKRYARTHRQVWD